MRVIDSKNRAHSRLTTRPTQDGSRLKTGGHQIKSPYPNYHQLKQKSKHPAPFFFRFNYLPLAKQLNNRLKTEWLSLTLGLIGVTTLTYILTTIHPTKIAHWLVYQSYLPLLVVFSLSCFWLTKFVSLSKWTAGVVSLGLTSLLFLKLQQVEIDIWVIVIIVGSVILNFITKHLVIRQ